MENFTLESKAFDNGGVIPRKYGYKNGNHSPPLKISGVPENTSSLALIMDDPDAMGAVGKVWVHWVLWNINPNTMELKENSIPSNCLEGKTDFGEIGYGGPAPPDKELKKQIKNHGSSIMSLSNDRIVLESSTKFNFDSTKF